MPRHASPAPSRRDWTISITLMIATLLSTLYVGASMVLRHTPTSAVELAQGWVFAIPLMAILMTHEFGHFIAGRLHRVDISPPYFIPVPFFLLGTLGAVISLRERIRTRNALLDIGAAGPLAGLIVAIPIFAYGIATSPIEPLPTEGNYLVEGRSILYAALLWGIKGPIPAGHDIMLTPTALAGWAGLLVTLINLAPFGQLDGGHVGYALLGKKQDRISRAVLRALPVLALIVCIAYGLPSYLRHDPEPRLVANATAGVQWLVWAALLWLMTRASGSAHPPTEDESLSPRRRIIGWVTLALFVVLFMPSWLRVQ